MAEGTVIQTLALRSPQEVEQKLRFLGARYRKPDNDTGAPLYKTAAGVVLRLANPTTLEVLSNCVC